MSTVQSIDRCPECETSLYDPSNPPVECPECFEKIRDPIHRYIDISQVEPLRDAAHDRPLRYDSLGRRLRDECFIVVGMDLALRADEMRRLKRSMFRLDSGELMLPSHVQKDYPQSGQSPPPATMELDKYGHFGTVRLLKSYFASEWYQARGTDYVFPSRQSKQVTTESIRNVVEDLAVYADIVVHRTDGEPAEPSELHPHALRHSLASYMLADQNTRFIDVRNRLRHRNLKTTENTYEHFQRR